MKRFFSIPIVVVFLSSLISVVYAAPAVKPIELRISHMNPAGSPEDLHYNRWAKKIEADSKGRLTFRIFPGGVLINAFECYSGTVKGIADIGASYRYDRKGAELTGFISICYPGIPDATIGTRILDEIRAKFPAYNKEWEKAEGVICGHGRACRSYHQTKTAPYHGGFQGSAIKNPGEGIS